MSQLDEILGALAGAPALPGAACVGHWATFDATIMSTAGRPPKPVLQARCDALAICSSCPALERCREHLESLPDRDRPQGVVAGIIVEPSAGPTLFAIEKAQRTQRINELATKGLTTAEIANITGVSKTTVLRELIG